MTNFWTLNKWLSNLLLLSPLCRFFGKYFPYKTDLLSEYPISVRMLKYSSDSAFTSYFLFQCNTGAHGFFHLNDFNISLLLLLLSFNPRPLSSLTGFTIVKFFALIILAFSSLCHLSLRTLCGHPYIGMFPQ